MRIEVKEVVNMIIGYVKIGYTGTDIKITKTFTSPLGEWIIEAFLGHTLNRKDDFLSVQFKKRIPGGGKMVYFTTHNTPCFIQSEDAQAVHTTLWNFVNGMIDTFPFLEKSLNYLIEASKAKLNK